VHDSQPALVMGLGLVTVMVISQWSTQLLNFGVNFVKGGPIIKGFIIDREGFRWRAAEGWCRAVHMISQGQVLVDCYG